MVAALLGGEGNYVVDLFQEVDEELRRDRAVELWKRYGNYVIGAALALVVGTAAYVGWRDYTLRQRAEMGERFFAAATMDSSRASAAFAEIGTEGSAGFAVLARFRDAALKAEAGDRDAAVAIYRGIAADGGISAELRSAAELLANLHALESLEPAELDRQLEALEAANNPWRHMALELAALAAARVGETAKARELYTKIADDPLAPAGMRARAAEMLSILGT
ncbi:MAG TPA: tetratricopeptide repeat protein [Alphaproteobacteria bacterium]